MNYKKCFKCLVEWPLHYFYKHSKMADGHLNKCKKCTKKDVIANRDSKVEKYREYDRERFQTSTLRRQRHAEYGKQYRLKYPEKYKAHNAVNNAVRNGRLIKFPCSVCGNINSHAHHEDYCKPLEVIWVCAAHHKELE